MSLRDYNIARRLSVATSVWDKQGKKTVAKFILGIMVFVDLCKLINTDVPAKELTICSVRRVRLDTIYVCQCEFAVRHIPSNDLGNGTTKFP